ncbi:hypothetical protein EV426DRAFT_711941 [Tirmania nivea]|nr:hypothetical protein EV426DRAFT_711941 [Tirmania nivea]
MTFTSMALPQPCQSEDPPYLHLVVSKFNTVISYLKPLRSRWQEQQDEVGDFFPSHLYDLHLHDSTPTLPERRPPYLHLVVSKFNAAISHLKPLRSRWQEQQDEIKIREKLLDQIYCMFFPPILYLLYPPLPLIYFFPITPPPPNFFPTWIDQGYVPASLDMPSTCSACRIDSIVQLCSPGLEVPFPGPAMDVVDSYTTPGPRYLPFSFPPPLPLLLQAPLRDHQIGGVKLHIYMLDACHGLSPASKRPSSSSIEPPLKKRRGRPKKTFTTMDVIPQPQANVPDCKSPESDIDETQLMEARPDTIHVSSTRNHYGTRTNRKSSAKVLEDLAYKHQETSAKNRIEALRNAKLKLQNKKVSGRSQRT